MYSDLSETVWRHILVVFYVLKQDFVWIKLVVGRKMVTSCVYKS